MEKFQDYVRLVERTLARQDFDNEPRELYEPISYVLALGGKRLRPALTLAACELFDGDVNDALMPALGIEIFHNFSLVHDDIMDQSDKRRGKPTVHHKWDVNRAILSGDAMLVKAYQYISKVESSILPKVLKSFNRTALEICEGQQLDVNYESGSDVREEDYLEMVRLKTAVLLGCALQLGALSAKASSLQADSLYDFGVYAGMAFQVQDDLLDAYGDPEKFGKKVGGDIIKEKNTLLMIYARELDPKKLQSLHDANLAEVDKVEQFRKFFSECGARKKAEAKRNELLKKALASLAAAEGKNEEVKSQLAEFAKWLAHRDR